MDYSAIGYTLWNFVLKLAQGISQVWAWLNSAVNIGKLEVFGWTIWEGFSFTPLSIGAPVLIVLLGFALIKTFVPMA